MKEEYELREALGHLTKQLDIEVKRWRVEADRADDFETKWQLNEDVIVLLKEKMAEDRAHYEGIIIQNKSTGSQLIESKEQYDLLRTERDDLRIEAKKLEERQEMALQRAQYLLALKSDLEQKNSQLLIEAQRSRESEEGALKKENLMKMQLDMQVDMCRELESRLEQAFTGWKLEKDKGWQILIIFQD